MIVFAVCYLIAILPGAAAFIRMRRWVQSPSGIETLRRWRPAAFIPVQIALACAWAFTVLSLPWLLWYVDKYTNEIVWSLFRSLSLVAVIFIVAAVLVIGNNWLRLHPLKRSITLGRIIGGGAAGFALGLGLMLKYSGIGATILYCDILTSLFMIRWWLYSNPLPKKRSGPEYS